MLKFAKERKSGSRPINTQETTNKVQLVKPMPLPPPPSDDGFCEVAQEAKRTTKPRLPPRTIISQNTDLEIWGDSARKPVMEYSVSQKKQKQEAPRKQKGCCAFLFCWKKKIQRRESMPDVLTIET